MRNGPLNVHVKLSRALANALSEKTKNPTTTSFRSLMLEQAQAKGCSPCTAAWRQMLRVKTSSRPPAARLR